MNFTKEYGHKLINAEEAVKIVKSGDPEIGELGAGNIDRFRQ